LIPRISQKVWAALTSLQLTIVCLALLMALVVLCTLAQVELGTLGAVTKYMRSFLVYWERPGAAFRLPVFPGGALVGLVLTLNLTAALIKRFDFSWRKSGLWTVHLGLILLVAGEFVAGAFQVDARMTIHEGQTVNYLESYRDTELVIKDVTQPSGEDVFGIPAARLAKGGVIALPGSPLSIKVHRYFVNAALTPKDPSEPALATMGVGANARITELAPVSAENQMNMDAALIEPLAGGRSYGIWLTSLGLGAPQAFIHEGRTYVIAMRIQRFNLPYSLTLKKFSHDLYPGTQIPKNFSSLVRLANPTTGEDRDVLIYMNQPLRYQGRTFYQSGFEGETVTILQVVQNPGWLLPYISCVIITLGLLVHFVLSMRRSTRRRSE
jgi:hypothetical protein